MEIYFIDIQASIDSDIQKAICRLQDSELRKNFNAISNLTNCEGIECTGVYLARFARNVSTKLLLGSQPHSCSYQSLLVALLRNRVLENSCSSVFFPRTRTTLMAFRPCTTKPLLLNGLGKPMFLNYLHVKSSSSEKLIELTVSGLD